MGWRSTGLGVWLTALWILLWGEFSWANLISGVIVAVLVVLGSGVGRTTAAKPDDRARVSALHAMVFVAFVLVKLIQSNVTLAWEIMRPKSRIRSGIVAVPLRTDSNAVMTTVANVITLTPGTMTLEATGSPATLYVHVLHLFDIDEVRRDLLHIEDLAVKAFGSRRARRQLIGHREKEKP